MSIRLVLSTRDLENIIVKVLNTVFYVHYLNIFTMHNLYFLSTLIHIYKFFQRLSAILWPHQALLLLELQHGLSCPANFAF